MVTYNGTTSNIKGTPLMPQPHVEHDINLVARLGGFNFGQEIEESRYKDAWRVIMAQHGKQTYCLGSESPISIPHGWMDVESSNIHPVHGGERHVTPARTISEVSGNKQGHKLCLLATHTISDPYKPDRRGRWQLHHEKLAALVAERYAAGYDVIYGGDLNNKRVALPKYNPHQRNLRNSGLDHLYIVVQPGHTMVVSGIRTLHGRGVELYTDHPALHFRATVLP